MSLRIYNSQTRKKEDFVPGNPPQVGIYVCGVTVYDSCHIGHARSMIVFDVIVRFLRAQGYEVTYVRNFTDIDDKIIARSNQEGVQAGELAEKYIEEFREDMAILGVLSPEVEPRATRHIPAIIALVQKLIDQGTAYAVDGDVFFAVEHFKPYGLLSGRNLEEMQAGARIEVDPRKRHPMDFALWKAGKQGEPTWESPWGPGRPGWHIECSAMSSYYLGETFDIHGGGQDLIFPHHENEQAQSMAASGRPLARYWVHNGFVTIRGEKMSKSLGNFLTIQEMVRRFHPEAVRLFLLSRHYRTPLDYSEETLQEAQNHLHRLYQLLKDLEHPEERWQRGGAEELSEEKIRELEGMVGEFKEKFNGALEDDFNTAQSLGYFYDLARKLNRLLDSLKLKTVGTSKDSFIRAAGVLKAAGFLLGILNLPLNDFFDQERERVLESRGLSKQRINDLVAERVQSRKEKNWARADALRTQLQEMGVILKDNPQGTEWVLDE
jgi:cysteinyl-tRNA synthetase